MTIYILLLVYLLLIDAFSNFIPKKVRRSYQTLFGGIGLWLVLSLRSVNCGVDLVQGELGSRNYLWMFNDVQSRPLSDLLFGYSDRIEAGWMVLCKLLSYVSGNFGVFLSIIAAIQLFFIGFVIHKTSKDIILSYIVYFCFGLYALSFSGLRQATAFAITFFASYFLMNHKPITFALLVLLASTIHMSALLFLVAFLFDKFKYTNRRAALSVLIVVLLVPVLGQLTEILSSFLFSDRYNINAALDSGGAYTMFTVYGVLVLLGFRVQDNRVNGFIRYMVIIAFAIQSLGVISSSYLTRLGYYFQMFFLLYFPVLNETYISSKNRKATMFVASLLFLVFFYLTMRSSPLNIVPYSFFWENPYAL